jgi:hypothetical protein
VLYLAAAATTCCWDTGEWLGIVSSICTIGRLVLFCIFKKINQQRAVILGGLTPAAKPLLYVLYTNKEWWKTIAW